MYDLIDLYKKKGVEGLSLKEWQNILNSEHDEVAIKNIGPGVIILSNGTIVGCVENYYDLCSNKDNYTKFKKNISNECYLIKKHFNIPITNSKDCMQCHQMCLDKRNDGLLKNKINI